MRVYEPEQQSKEKDKPPRVAQALLFLGPNRGTREQPRFEPIGSGVRLWTEDRTLLVPVQVRNPGPYWLTVQRDVDWSELVRQARADAAAIEDLFARKQLRPLNRRNRALLDWVRHHRHEFGAPTTTEHPDRAAQGWGHLETEIFQWVLDTCEPADGWPAVKLYAELNRGTNPPLHEPAFGMARGRALLLRVATANDVLEGDRVRALDLLGHPFTLWAGPLERLPQVQPLDAREQMELLDRLTPLLATPSAPLRAAAAAAIRRASIPDVLPDTHPHSRRALPDLVKAYRAEPPGEARDELAEAVCVVGGPKHWQELTGNPPRVLVRLRGLERREPLVYFWLNLLPCGQAVYECPTLRLERLDKANKVAEMKQIPLPVVHKDKAWGVGWDGDSLLFVQFAVQDFKPGTWRVTVQGTAGKDKDKQKWVSEPKTFVIEPPPKPKDERPHYGKKEIAK